MTQAWTGVFLAALGLAGALRLWLSLRQERCVRAHRDAVPDAFAAHVPPEAHRKAADYTVARLRLGRVALGWRAAVLLAFTLGGGLELLGSVFDGATLLGGAGFVLAAFFLAEVAQLPLAAWRTFRIEERFGFNRTTPGLFAKDLARTAALGLLLGGPLAAGALWVMREGGALWWVWLWAGWLAVSLFFTWAYPAWIAPLFWTFRPLDDAALRERIAALLARVGFRAEAISVMDGSRRSAHANAYFTGLGEKKRIVLFDTLCETLRPDEIEAVLAHELGHFRLRHLWRRLAAGAAMGLLALGGFALVADQAWFFEGLGVSSTRPDAALVLYLWVLPLFTFPLAPLLSAWSRRHEYEADAFAAAHADAAAMVRALVRLYEHNASTLTPDPLYSTFFDSHPPAPLRVARLRETA